MRNIASKNYTGMQWGKGNLKRRNIYCKEMNLMWPSRHVKQKQQDRDNSTLRPCSKEHISSLKY